MEYVRAPQKCSKSVHDIILDAEVDHSSMSSAVTTRKATAEDIARMAPKKTIMLDIRGELEREHKPENIKAKVAG